MEEGKLSPPSQLREDSVTIGIGHFLKDTHEPCDNFKAVEDETSMLITEISKKGKLKQFLSGLPFVLITIFILYFKKLFVVWYISALSFTCSWIFFWYFPNASIFLQKKPIYVEDLIINNSDIDIRYRYIKFYSNFSNLFMAFLFMLVADYLFVRRYDEGIFDDPIQIIIGLGGLSSFVIKALHVGGKLFLFLSYKYRNLEISGWLNRLFQ